MRLRATESQAGLTWRQRRLNVRGAFVVSDPAAVTQKHILVIDDIFTTGSTARAAAKALMEAGAASVWVATLARARHIHDHRIASARFDDEAENSALAGNAPATDLQRAFTHSSHGQSSFGEGIKGCRWESHDSCAQAEVHRPGRGHRGRTGNHPVGSHSADAGAGAERLL